MRIHSPEVEAHDGFVRMSVRVEMRRSVTRLPEALWFEFSASYEPWLSQRADAMAVCLLPVAMAAGEEIELCAPLSLHLLRGMEEYQRVFQLWCSEWKIVPIDCEVMPTPEALAPEGVGCSFSGGVDSFYTLYTHLPPREPLPDYCITHALFIHGFDIPLDDKQTFQTVSRAYQTMLEEQGVAPI